MVGVGALSAVMMSGQGTATNAFSFSAGEPTQQHAAQSKASRANERRPLPDKTVALVVEGKRQSVRTAAATVDQLLAERGILLDFGEDVAPAGSTPLEDGASVVVGKVTTTVVSNRQKVDFSTKTVEDSTQPKGTKKVTTRGKPGATQETFVVQKVGDVEVSRTSLAAGTLAQPVQQVVTVGTLDAPDPSTTVVNASQAKSIARVIAQEDRGWGSDQFSCLDSLWTRESGWNVQSSNASSGAYGIPQALPGAKMASIADDWQTNAATQIRWGLGYIADRYGTPCGAWAHSQSAGWY